MLAIVRSRLLIPLVGLRNHRSGRFLRAGALRRLRYGAAVGLATHGRAFFPANDAVRSAGDLQGALDPCTAPGARGTLPRAPARRSGGRRWGRPLGEGWRHLGPAPVLLVLTGFGFWPVLPGHAAALQRGNSLFGGGVSADAVRSSCRVLTPGSEWFSDHRNSPFDRPDLCCGGQRARGWRPSACFSRGRAARVRVRGQGEEYAYCASRPVVRERSARRLRRNRTHRALPDRGARRDGTRGHPLRVRRCADLGAARAGVRPLAAAGFEVHRPHRSPHGDARAHLTRVQELRRFAFPYRLLPLPALPHASPPAAHDPPRAPRPAGFAAHLRPLRRHARRLDLERSTRPLAAGEMDRDRAARLARGPARVLAERGRLLRLRGP